MRIDGKTMDAGLGGKKIAYFSMEVGLKSDVPTYAGGLGVLAGDTIRSSADLSIPLAGVTLLYRMGYFSQEIDAEGRQTEHPQEWDPRAHFLEPLPDEVTVKIQGRDVRVKAWLYTLKSLTGGVVPILFLDTDLPGNTDNDRKITQYLYGGDAGYRLKQEMVLGIGGVRMLKALDVDVRKYHMNEGHSSLLTLELMRENGMDPEAVKESCIFTTHTPVDTGHDKFDYSLVRDLVGDEEDVGVLRRFGGDDVLNMTLLALNLSDYVNGVAKRHGEVSMALFPGYKIHSITNGIHSFTWTCPCFKKIYDIYIPGWANEPEKLVRVGGIPDEEIWVAHQCAKRHLLDRVKAETGVAMDPGVLTLGFARRATAYKRPGFIFTDIERLRRANRRGKIQIIVAGKAHPKDSDGKKAIEEVFSHIKALKGEIDIVYLKNYDMHLAGMMVAGSDVWLNTPLSPMEASGTSGMKAAHNGTVNFSVLDGWWIEGWIEGVTGWAIGPEPHERISPEETVRREIDDFYAKLEYVIIPLYYAQRDAWIRMMNGSIGMIAYYFNSHRMMRRYVTEAYF